MPVIVKLPSGNWRAQVRRKGKYVSNSFMRRADADAWALETERTIDQGRDPRLVNPLKVRSFSDIIDLHIKDMLEVGKIIRRSKSAVLEALKISLGGYRLEEMTRATLIEYGKKRAKQGAGPATLAVDFSYIGTLMSHAAAVHGISVFPEQVKLARIALARLGLGSVEIQDSQISSEVIQALKGVWH